MITDEMVDAALREFKCWAGDGYSPSKQQIRAALEAAERAAGMAVVPREPTEAMLQAGNLPLGCRRDCNLGLIRAASVYTAMINTAEGKTE